MTEATLLYKIKQPGLLPSSNPNYARDSDYLVCLKRIQKGLEIAKLPLHEQAAAAEQEEKQWKDGASVFAGTALFTGLANVRGDFSEYRRFFSQQYHAACKEITLTALATERFRLNHQRWPENLDALVAKKYLSAVPANPFTGQPITFEMMDDGIRIGTPKLDVADKKYLEYVLHDANARRQTKE